MFVEAGAKVNAVNDSGNTAIHYAALTGSARIVEFLAANGLPLDIKSKQGKTPLDMRMRRDRPPPSFASSRSTGNQTQPQSWATSRKHQFGAPRNSGLTRCAKRAGPPPVDK
jgi:hypothetical protein